MRRISAAATSLCLVIGLSACASDPQSPAHTDVPTTTRSEAQPTPTVLGSADPTESTSATQVAAKSSEMVDKPNRWVEVFRATASQQDSVQNKKSKIFRLDGDARIRYVVTGNANRPEDQGRAADIMFQEKISTQKAAVLTPL